MTTLKNKRLKVACFTLGGVGSFAVSFYFYYFYFFNNVNGEGFEKFAAYTAFLCFSNRASVN